MIDIGEILLDLWNSSGFADGGWQNLVMLIISCVLLYLAIVKKFEPLLLTGIAFGCLLSNLPMGGLYHQELWTKFMAHEIGYGTVMPMEAASGPVKPRTTAPRKATKTPS